mgnify:CR=1 FL=1
MSPFEKFDTQEGVASPFEIKKKKFLTGFKSPSKLFRIGKLEYGSRK